MTHVLPCTGAGGGASFGAMQSAPSPATWGWPPTVPASCRPWRHLNPKAWGRTIGGHLSGFSMGLPVMCEALFLGKLKIFAQARRKCCYPPSPLLSGRLVCHVGPCQKKHRRPGTARQRVQDRGPGIAARRKQWGLRASLPRQPPDRGVAKHSSDRASALQLRLRPLPSSSYQSESQTVHRRCPFYQGGA